MCESYKKLSSLHRKCVCVCNNAWGIIFLPFYVCFPLTLSCELDLQFPINSVRPSYWITDNHFFQCCFFFGYRWSTSIRNKKIDFCRAPMDNPSIEVHNKNSSHSRKEHLLSHKNQQLPANKCNAKLTRWNFEYSLPQPCVNILFHNPTSPHDVHSNLRWHFNVSARDSFDVFHTSIIEFLPLLTCTYNILRETFFGHFKGFK